MFSKIQNLLFFQNKKLKLNHLIPIFFFDEPIQTALNIFSKIMCINFIGQKSYVMHNNDQ